MEKQLYTFKAKVTTVIDGDTFDGNIDLGFNIHYKDRFRLLGIDTPESAGHDKVEKGVEVKQIVKDLIEGKDVVIQTTKPDKYGRYLAIVMLGDMNVNKWLVEKGHAKEYWGDNKAKLGWTTEAK